MDRVNSVGVPIPDALPPVYHLPPSSFWWLNPAKNKWQELTRESARSLLITNYGQNGVVPGRGQMAQVDKTIGRIIQDNVVEAVVTIGWEEPGVKEVDGVSLIVQKGCTHIEPLAGEWPEIETYLNRLFNTHIQYQMFLGWMQNAARAFYGKTDRRPAQALILTGPKASGKSFLQMRIVTPALGGKTARPYKWLMGKTTFNSELFESVHLISEDDFHLADANSRRMLSAALKMISANTTQEYHRKHLPAHTLKPFWRLSMSLNDEVHHLAALPEIDESLSDKVIILQTEPGAIHLSTDVNDNVMQRKVKEELPAFIEYLLNVHEIPEKYQDKRYGICAYINPTVKKAIDNASEEKLLAEYFKAAYPDVKDLHLSEYQIIHHGEDRTVPTRVKDIFRSSTRLKGCLRRLTASGMLKKDGEDYILTTL
jgi:hypothetical protein